MFPITSDDTKFLARALALYRPRSTIARIGGLLTAPHLHGNTLRLELLAHLSVAHCAGHKKAEYGDIMKWLNNYLSHTILPSIEDPVEDVFVSNVSTREGNRRLFEGIWESSDYFLQVLIDTLTGQELSHDCKYLLSPVFALLRLSECVAERLNIPRWHIEQSHAKGILRIDHSTRVGQRARAITFTKADLESLGIKQEELAPFIFRDEDRQRLLTESTGHSSLERRPLVNFGDALILVLPHAVSPAVRQFVLSELNLKGYLKEYSNILSNYQAEQTEKVGFRELKYDSVSLNPPMPDTPFVPALHTWLLKYDNNKYIHIVLLHDQLQWVEEQGLSSIMKYPEEVQNGLENYLNKVARHCQTLHGYAEGMTLVVMAGLGRGYMLGFNNWPDKWRLSAIRISDLLMLARGIDLPIKRYLKCIKQKEWAEQKGVHFENNNGDFNFYCYWRHFNYQLVPRDIPIDNQAMIWIGTDFVLPMRQKLRNSIDQHVVKTASGQFTQVIRFGHDSYFKSIQLLPIYVSTDYLLTGILAGVVETSRGPSWLIIEPREGDERVQLLLYEMWSGFISLYDRLVNEIETLLPKLSNGPLEIRLDFQELKVPEYFVETETYEPINEPELIINHVQRTANIKFPPDLLVLFQQPENTGEKFILRVIARGLINLHEGSEGNVKESIMKALLNKVIGDTGIRILHLFHTYSSIEHLLARQEQRSIFLAHEDFVFSKLMLSDGCTSVKPIAILDKKEECNDFLHKLVKKVLEQLRELLRQFDRNSVIRKTLEVHEAIIHDRDHWRRTAQAVIALYSSAENVFEVVQKRERDRNQVALPTRTILELAICECPESGGKLLSQWELDELLAKGALMINTAMESDAIHNDLIEPIVHLHVNGEHTIDKGFYETVIHPFLNNYLREEFEEAASDYSKLYQRERPNEQKKVDGQYSQSFIEAFSEEFDLTPDEAIDGIAELMDLAVERDSVVIETTLGSLRQRLINTRGLSSTACEAFFKTFGLFHRPTWDHPPNGFKNKDLFPWRFRRRLSAMVRPLFIFGKHDNDKVLYGAGSLAQGFSYLLNRTETGQLPSDFFSSTKMKTYIGRVNFERGHSFAESVAQEISKAGWETRTEVQMTELGATPELGDIDVLAWKISGEVLLIECKRLQLARTVAEIAEICNRFRGEAKDELGKHIRRVDWIIQHAENLKHIIGFSPDTCSIDARLVTNTHVPIMYLESLPIKAEKIVPWGRLVGGL